MLYSMVWYTRDLLVINFGQEPQATLRWLVPLYRAGTTVYPRMLGYSPAPTLNLIWFSGLEDLLDIMYGIVYIL